MTHGWEPPDADTIRAQEQRLYHVKHSEIREETDRRWTPASPVRDTVSATEDAVIGTLALTVLIFVSTDCPVSNRYAPEITRLYEQFAPQGVRFRLVYPNRLDTPAAIEATSARTRFPAIAERDPDHNW